MKFASINLNDFLFTYLKLFIDEENILWITLDCPAKSTNVLNSALRQELAELIDGIKIGGSLNENNKKIIGIVFKSDKTTGFAAGADINEFKAIGENNDFVKETRDLVSSGWTLYENLEKLSNQIPTVALINGFCMGGGLEFALACKYIVTIDHPKTRMSLPEVQLGIYPGWGGIKRLPRRIGAISAFDLMLTGKTVDSRKAQKIGLSDFSSPPRVIDSTCVRLIKTQPKKRKLSILNKMLLGVLRPLFSKILLFQVKKRVNPIHYPAPFGIIELWNKYDGNPCIDPSIHDRMIGSNTTKNLMRIFFLRERLKSIGKVNKASHRNKLEHVHVIGAGTMGADIAILCASKDFKVTIQDTSEKQIAKAIAGANKFMRRKIKDKYLAQKFLDNLIPDSNGYGIKHADVIIEAITENLDIKKELFSLIEKQSKKTAIIATNTSTIPLEKISKNLKSPNRLVGIHFFNPVSKMPLVEIIKTEILSKSVENASYDFVNKIGKLPLPVKSYPGFFVNAVLGPYLHNSMRSIDGGYSPEQVDSAMKSWGMPMGPLELIDVVGLDILLDAGKAMLKDGESPKCLFNLVKKKHLGKKTNKGFYQWKNGRAVKNKVKSLDSQQKRNLAENLIQPLIKKTEELVNKGIVGDGELADAGVIFGTGFAPFRGGPLNYQNQLKNKTKLIN